MSNQTKLREVPQCQVATPDSLSITDMCGNEIGELVPGDGPGGWVHGKPVAPCDAWAVNASLRQFGAFLGIDVAGLMVPEADNPAVVSAPPGG